MAFETLFRSCECVWLVLFSRISPNRERVADRVENRHHRMLLTIKTRARLERSIRFAPFRRHGHDHHGHFIIPPKTHVVSPPQPQFLDSVSHPFSPTGAAAQRQSHASHGNPLTPLASSTPVQPPTPHFWLFR